MRYLIFGGECYYPNAGGYSLLAQLPDLDHAQRMADSFIGKWAITQAPTDYVDMKYHRIEWAHVLDAQSTEVVHEAGDEPYSTARQIILIVDEEPD